MQASASKPANTKPPTPIQFFTDHIVDQEGKRWALSCDWRPWWVDTYVEDIPDFLRISPEARRQAWANRPVTSSGPPPMATPKTMKEYKEYKKSLVSDEKKAKNAAALARLKEQHAGQRYDRKLKMWIEVEDALETRDKNGTPGKTE